MADNEPRGLWRKLPNAIDREPYSRNSASDRLIEMQNRFMDAGIGTKELAESRSWLAKHDLNFPHLRDAKEAQEQARIAREEKAWEAKQEQEFYDNFPTTFSPRDVAERHAELRDSGMDLDQIVGQVKREAKEWTRYAENVLAERDQQTILRLFNGDKSLDMSEVKAAVARETERDARAANARSHDKIAERDSAIQTLHEQFRAEREISSAKRSEAEQEVYTRFSSANRSDRVQAQQERSQQITAVRAAHPTLAWKAWLERESRHGNELAGQLLAQQKERARDNALER